MAGYASVRSDALREVVEWAPRNLRDDDELAVISWDSAADLVMPPTSILQLTNVPPNAGIPLGGNGSNIRDALDLIAQLPVTPCHSALVAITDTLIDPLDGRAVEQALRDAGVGSIGVILPQQGSASPTWMSAFPSTRIHHAQPDDPTATARSVGEAIAAATGQLLE